MSYNFDLDCAVALVANCQDGFVEFGFDVWLYRMCIEFPLPGSRT